MKIMEYNRHGATPNLHLSSTASECGTNRRLSGIVDDDEAGAESRECSSSVSLKSIASAPVCALALERRGSPLGLRVFVNVLLDDSLLCAVAASGDSFFGAAAAVALVRASASSDSDSAETASESSNSSSGLVRARFASARQNTYIYNRSISSIVP